VAKLAHLLQDEKPPVYQLDFGDRVTATVAEVVSREAVQRLAPFIAELAATVEGVGKSVDDGVDKHSEALSESQKAVESASKALEKAVKTELEAVRGALRRSIADAGRDTKVGVDEAIQRLVEAMGRIEIPDHGSEIGRVAEIQQTILDAVKRDPAPREWNFTVNRNRNGFIQSVTAKAVE
jgi:hypothetical protein